MTDVFISYKRRLRPRVEVLAAALKQIGVDVWFDASLEPGSTFSGEISHQVRNAKCVLACFSDDVFPHGGDQGGWVVGEALIGRDRKALVATMLEPTDLDPPWNTIHIEDLTAVHAADDISGSVSWLRVVGAIGRHVGRPGLVPLVHAQAIGTAAALSDWTEDFADDPFAGEVRGQTELLEAVERSMAAPPGADPTLSGEGVAPAELDPRQEASGVAFDEEHRVAGEDSDGAEAVAAPAIRRRRRRWLIGVGVALAILVGIVAVGLLVLPSLVDSPGYRQRLAALGKTLVGTDVAIDGPIKLSLLPETTLEISGVRVGPGSRPLLQVETVKAGMSFWDFLFGGNQVQSLFLLRPVMSVTVLDDGSASATLPPADLAAYTVSSIDVAGGTLRIAWPGVEPVELATGIDGTMRLDAQNGAVHFDGDAEVRGTPSSAVLSVAQPSQSQPVVISLSLASKAEGFTLATEGKLTGGEAPKYSGSVKYRLAPSLLPSDTASDVPRGALALDSDFEMTAARLLLTSFTLTPDLSRAAERFVGASDFTIGKAATFNVVLSAGTISLPAREGPEVASSPYELVRLLGEAPLIPIPPFPGRVGIDVSHLDLHGTPLSDVRADLSTDAKTWMIEELGATLPGDTKVVVAGRASNTGGRPAFAGTVKIDSQKLDLLAQFWRRPQATNPLFNLPASLTAAVDMSGDTLNVTDGALVISEKSYSFSGAVGVGNRPNLTVVASLPEMDETDSAAFAALLPDISAEGDGFGVTFPRGEFDVTARAATVLGLGATNAVAKGSWVGGVLELEKLSAEDYGGAAFSLKATAFGGFAKPEVSGSGNVAVGSNTAPLFARLADLWGLPPGVARFLKDSAPVSLDVRLDPPGGLGGQTMVVTGKVAQADARFVATFDKGIARALAAPILVVANLDSVSPAGLAAQLGSPEVRVFKDSDLLAEQLTVGGTPGNLLDVIATLSNSSEHVVLQGRATPWVSVGGIIDIAVEKPEAVAQALSGLGIEVHRANGKTAVNFNFR